RPAARAGEPACAVSLAARGEQSFCARSRSVRRADAAAHRADLADRSSRRGRGRARAARAAGGARLVRRRLHRLCRDARALAARRGRELEDVLRSRPRAGAWPPVEGGMLRVSEEVAAALREGRAVVALETSVVAQGLPPPANLQAARSCGAAVRAEGA